MRIKPREESMVTTCLTIKKRGSYSNCTTANTRLDAREQEEMVERNMEGTIPSWDL